MGGIETMSKKIKTMKELREKKKSLLKSLEWAIVNNDEGLVKACYIELERVSKEMDEQQSK